MLHRSRRIRKHPKSEINVVPYIDVMLVLLVIFMITAPLLTQGVNVNLPQAKSRALSKQDQTPMIVSVDRDGQYFLNTDPHPSVAINGQTLMSEVSAKLEAAKAQHTEQPVYVKGDKDADYGKIMTAMVLLQQAGAENVGLITEPINP